MGVVNAPQRPEWARRFELTVREIPVYVTQTYMTYPDDLGRGDESVWRYQQLAQKAAGEMRFGIGRLKRKMQWRDQHIARICWYWDLDG